MLGIVFRVIPTVETTTKMNEMKETACRYMKENEGDGQNQDLDIGEVRR